jgi:hypothetical protein
MTDEDTFFRDTAVDLAAVNDSMNRTYMCSLDRCVVDIGTSLDPLLQTRGDHINLNFLQELNGPSDLVDRFLPETIYVRESMRTIFALFLRDAKAVHPKHTKTILVGSSGVGKSVLFFLAALYRSQARATIYFRRAQSDTLISVFAMFPHQDPHKVHVLFTMVLDAEKVDQFPHRLLTFAIFLANSLGYVRENYYVFIDGPRHDDMPNTLSGTFDYLCPGDGYPLFHSEQFKTHRRWILDGWSQREAISALTTTEHDEHAVQDIQVVVNAHWLCGGRIRDIIASCTPHGYAATKDFLDDMVAAALEEEVALVTTSSYLPGGAQDRLRTMFRRSDSYNRPDLMPTVQRVDSIYVVSRLCKFADPELFFDAYALAVRIGEKDFQGLCLRNIVHQWFETTKPAPISTVFWGPGTCAMSILEAANVYWIPSFYEVSDLIDSAVVIGGTLHILQVTVTEVSTFRAGQCVEAFVSHVRKKLAFRQVRVWMVVPKGTEYHDPLFPQLEVLWRCHLHELDVTSVDSIWASLRKLPFLTQSMTATVKTMLHDVWVSLRSGVF